MPGPRLGGVQGTGFGIAALVGAAVTAAGGRRATELHVEIRIPLPPLLVTTSWLLPAGTSTVKFRLPLAAVRLLTGTLFCSTLPGWGVVPPQVALTPTAVKAAAVAHAVAEIRGSPGYPARPLIEGGIGAPVEAVGQHEHLERLAGLPAAGVGQQVEGAVVDTGTVVHVDAVIVIAGVADGLAVPGRVLEVAQ